MFGATLDNVNYRILLQQHGGDEIRARAAWQRILGLGGYGNVPFEYEGGLDVKGLRVVVDERKQKQSQGVAYNVTSHARGNEAYTMPSNLPQAPSDLEDRIKEIEDITAGDNPNKKRRTK